MQDESISSERPKISKNYNELNNNTKQDKSNYNYFLEKNETMINQENLEINNPNIINCNDKISQFIPNKKLIREDDERENILQSKNNMSFVNSRKEELKNDKIENIESEIRN